MDLKDKLEELAIRVNRMRDSIHTEEATKTACVLPFIQALGYDVFNPSEVVPEFISDTPGKKGEKVDYAILKDEKIIILIECKPIGAELEIKYASQLFRYFQTTAARFGVLTDGIRYLFYSDIKKQNIMDEIPFFEFNLLLHTGDKQTKQVEELKKFAKSTFDLDTIIGSATNLKNSRAIKAEIGRVFEETPDELVKLLSKNIYEGRFTQQILDKFKEQTKRALNEYISDRVEDRLNNALASNKTGVSPEEVSTLQEVINAEEAENGIETTEEEKESFRIIQAIAAELVDVDRIVMRDAKTYCAILFDDNNRQPIVRLYYRKTKLSLMVFDVNSGTKVEIEKVSQIYKSREGILTAIKNYL
ncbi:type I restriction endonuclease [uncultured Sphaerochaeta sp.]|uniref:type I restriction endonuclease n=1 Tax=uncultured Sphaerochaeta sp. TaxID=886478 RepID=UPI002A0A7321|nr:type I restriction endonuclease [uncultured Sphaerochaeta sp.]